MVLERGAARAGSILATTAFSVTATSPGSSAPRSSVCRKAYAGWAPGAERAPPFSFMPPPPLAHIDEGSFFVGEDKTLLQVQGGEAVPVTHGDTR